jgi:hypothetical protein
MSKQETSENEPLLEGMLHSSHARLPHLLTPRSLDHTGVCVHICMAREGGSDVGACLSGDGWVHAMG